jgi:soluble P-type ATPase
MEHNEKTDPVMEAFNDMFENYAKLLNFNIQTDGEVLSNAPETIAFLNNLAVNDVLGKASMLLKQAADTGRTMEKTSNSIDEKFFQKYYNDEPDVEQKILEEEPN